MKESNPELVLQYPSSASEVPQANHSRWDSFSLIASLTAGVHHQVWGLPPRQAPQTLRAAASTIDAENMVHSHSVSNLPRNLVKVLTEVEVEYIPGRGLRQTLPAVPHYALGPAKSVQLSPPPADPTHHQVVISGQLTHCLHPSVENMRPKV
ncbi:hypothetical protein ILYODFUR_010114 [Ilyodon furcidens]|uniref:Uncharacterized protein n=1 Tax=Ilyodon furcidens TaxID=33524 RepID=A0ABV0T6V4_9TELE